MLVDLERRFDSFVKSLNHFERENLLTWLECDPKTFVERVKMASPSNLKTEIKTGVDHAAGTNSTAGATPLNPNSPRGKLYALHQELCQEAFKLMERKNHDYAGKGNDDPFANFRRTEALGICKTEAGMLVRMADKLSRLSTYVNDGELKVKDEGVKDTVLDLINYSVLLYAYLKSKEGK